MNRSVSATRGRFSTLLALPGKRAARWARAPALATFSRAYLFLLLLVMSLLVPLPFSAVALALLLIQLYLVYKSPRAGISLVVVLLTLLLLPWMLQELMTQPFSVLLMIPAIPFWDHVLKENASSQVFQSRVGRSSMALVSLAAALLVVVIVSAILSNLVLAITAALLFGYLVIVFLYVLYRTRSVSLIGSRSWARVVAGDLAEVVVAIENKAGIPQYVLLVSPHPWVHITPLQFRIGQEGAKVKLVITPPLSGPSQLVVQAISVDAWGLTQKRQSLELLELHVIPRARYAAWLARKYLEQTGSQLARAGAAVSVSRLQWAMRGGVEFYDTRLYQPGDALKNIDWRHTAKLHRLVVKEYLGIQAQTVIALVNLTVADDEEADEIAHDLITLALTLADDGIPTALAAYDHEKVHVVTPAMDPREVLKEALKVSQHIVQVQPVQRLLQLPGLKRLRRAVGQLEQVGTESASKLKEILQLENEAIEATARDNPATAALLKVTGETVPPAVIAVVSGWNHDAEALLATLDKLEKRGYHAIEVEMRGKGRASSGHLARLPASSSKSGF